VWGDCASPAAGVASRHARVAEAARSPAVVRRFVFVYNRRGLLDGACVPGWAVPTRLVAGCWTAGASPVGSVPTHACWRLGLSTLCARPWLTRPTAGRWGVGRWSTARARGQSSPLAFGKHRMHRHDAVPQPRGGTPRPRLRYARGGLAWRPRHRRRDSPQLAQAPVAARPAAANVLGARRRSFLQTRGPHPASGARTRWVAFLQSPRSPRWLSRPSRQAGRSPARHEKTRSWGTAPADVQAEVFRESLRPPLSTGGVAPAGDVAQEL